MNLFVRFSDGDEAHMQLAIDAVQISGFVALRVIESGSAYGTIIYYPYHRINLMLTAKAK